MDSVDRGRLGDGSRLTMDQKNSHCVFFEVHKQPQFTCQADTVANNSLTPIVALLVCPSKTVHSKWLYI